jgi:hypothetical protein
MARFTYHFKQFFLQIFQFQEEFQVVDVKLEVEG